MNNELMNVRQAASCLLTSEKSILQLVEDGHLQCVRQGNDMLFNPEEIFDFYEKLDGGKK